MLEILEFIFQDFWHWAGTLCLLAVIFTGLIGLFNFNIIKQIKDK